MRSKRSKMALAGIGATAAVVASVAGTGTAVAHPALAAAAVGSPAATYEMNEPPGSTVMTDSSGFGIHGVIQSSPEITTGYVNYDGAVGYHWTRRAPNEAPAVPARIIQVADNINLEPGSGASSFTVELRFRTKEKFGNIVQKGQATTRGGQWKIQNPQGMPSCLFKGSIGRVSTRVKVPINDNLWHVLTCEWTPTRVTAYVDGVQVNRKNGSTGAINNTIPMTVGGKINCNQVDITCDYFSGDIDWLHIYKS